MYEGVLIAESLRVGAEFDQRWAVTKISRIRPGNTVEGQPEVWTLLDFELSAERAQLFAEWLVEALDEPGWYCDFRSDQDVFVIFSGRIFRYPRGDESGRAEAMAFGRRLGVPEAQLDWSR